MRLLDGQGLHRLFGQTTGDIPLRRDRQLEFSQSRLDGDLPSARLHKPAKRSIWPGCSSFLPTYRSVGEIEMNAFEAEGLELGW
jgi:hypothetical protein